MKKLVPQGDSPNNVSFADEKQESPKPKMPYMKSVNKKPEQVTSVHQLNQPAPVNENLLKPIK